MRKLGSGWVCDDCQSFGKEGEVTPHDPLCPSKAPFGPAESGLDDAVARESKSAEGLVGPYPSAADIDRIVREAELSPAELAEIGAEKLEERVEPQPPTDLELEKPAAKLEELQALAGLPVAEEERCGAAGPDNLTCRLKPGHEGGLHAARGRTWTDAEDGQDPHQAAAAGLWGPPADNSELVRIANALEGIRAAIEHYVQDVLHRTR